MDLTADIILIAFYIDAKTRNYWNEDIFLQYNGGVPIQTYIKSEKENAMYQLMNRLARSKISDARSRWHLILDLEFMGKLDITPYDKQKIADEIVANEQPIPEIYHL